MIRHILVSLALACGLGLLIVSQAQAGGPGTGGRRVRLDDEPAGPYLLRVVTSPTPPRVENLYLEIRVQDAANGEVLTEVSVFARASQIEGDAPTVEDEASHDIAPNPVEYGVHLPVSEPGRWQITVLVEGEKGRGEVQFEEQVSRPTSLSTVVVIGLPVGGLVLLVIVFLAMQRQRDRAGVGRQG